MKANLRLALRWRPRDENKPADDLTNLKTEDFKVEHRVPLSFSDFDLSLLTKLWEVRSEFLDREGLKRWPVAQTRHKKDKTPW